MVKVTAHELEEVFDNAKMAIHRVEGDSIVHRPELKEQGDAMKATANELRERAEYLDKIGKEKVRQAYKKQSAPVKPKEYRTGYIDLGVPHMKFLLEYSLAGVDSNDALTALNNESFNEPDNAAFITTVGNLQPVYAREALKQLEQSGSNMIHNMKHLNVYQKSAFCDVGRIKACLDHASGISNMIINMRELAVEQSEMKAEHAEAVAEIKEELDDVKKSLASKSQVLDEAGIADWKQQVIIMRGNGMTVKAISLELEKSESTIKRVIKLHKEGGLK